MSNKKMSNKKNSAGGDNSSTSNGKGSVGRTRNFATIVYPDSAPNNWFDILEGLHIPAFVSPLHDKDEKEDGSLKKPHYHVLLMFDGVKTQEQAREICKKFGGVGVEKVNSLKAYARYLIHIDNPDKAQYQADDVVSLSGASYAAVIQSSEVDTDNVVDMLHYIRENGITSFAFFVDACAKEKKEWFKIVTDRGRAYLFREYIKSYSWELDNNSFKKCNHERNSVRMNIEQ